jgi:hypothetical protein
MSESLQEMLGWAALIISFAFLLNGFNFVTINKYYTNKKEGDAK